MPLQNAVPTINFEISEESALKPQNNEPTLSRRRFLGFAGAAVGTAAIAALTKFPQQEAHAEQNEISHTQDLHQQSHMAEAAGTNESLVSEAGEIFLTPEHGVGQVFDRIRQERGVGAASTEAIMDESLASIIEGRSVEGVDETGDAYIEHQIEYNGEIFPVRIKTIKSTRNENLNEYFNIGYDTEEFEEKDITTITYNPNINEGDNYPPLVSYFLDKATLDVSDTTTFEDYRLRFMLPLEFYNQTPDTENPNLVTFSLRKDWTAEQFAQAYAPKHIRAQAKHTNIESFNALNDVIPRRQIQKISIIYADKLLFNINARAFLFPSEDFPSDQGSFTNPKWRTATEQGMHYEAAITGHELRHCTDLLMLSPNNGYILSSIASRNNYSENMAQASWAAVLREIDGDDLANSMMGNPLIFMQNAQGEFNFRSYTPALFLALCEPFINEMQVATGNTAALYDENGQLTAEGMTEINLMYMKLRDDMQRQLPPQEILDQTKDVTYYGPAISHLMVPLIYAKYIEQGIDIPTNKGSLYEDVRAEATKVLETNIRMLEDIFSLERNASMYKFFTERMLNLYKYTVPGQIVPRLEVPPENEEISIIRQEDSVYAANRETDPKFFVEYDYRKYNPMYKIIQMPQIDNDLLELFLEKTSTNEDFSAWVIFPDTEESYPLEQGIPYKPGSTGKGFLCFVDKRLDQINDDLEGNEPEVLKAYVRMKPTPTPTNTPEPTATQTSTPVPPMETPTATPSQTPTPPQGITTIYMPAIHKN